MTTSHATSAGLLYGQVERRPLLLANAPAQPPRRPRESVVSNGRESLLVAAKCEQKVRDAVRRRKVVVGRADAEAVHAAAAIRDQRRAGLAEKPDAELAALERETGVPLEVAGVVAE